jgi:hypothetical protein
MSTPLLATSYWMIANRDFSIQSMKAGQININDTSPATIESIGQQFWVHKTARSFQDNYRKVSSDLQVKKQVKGGRSKRMVESCYYFMLAPPKP